MSGRVVGSEFTGEVSWREACDVARDVLVDAEAKRDALAAREATANPDDDFYEDDEPLADVLAAWERNAAGEHPTAPPDGGVSRGVSA